MGTFSDIAMTLTASIWYKPGTYEELYQRKVDVLKDASEYSFNTILMLAKSNGWIYEKGGVYYCYRKTVKNVLNCKGFEIEIDVDTRSEFRKQFDKLYSK